MQGGQIGWVDFATRFVTDRVVVLSTRVGHSFTLHPLVQTLIMGFDPVDLGVDVHCPGVSHTLFTPAIIAVLDTESSCVALHSEDMGIRSSPLFEVSTRDKVPLLHEQQFGPG